MKPWWQSLTLPQALLTIVGACILLAGVIGVLTLPVFLPAGMGTGIAPTPREMRFLLPATPGP